MDEICILKGGHSTALDFALKQLKSKGYTIVDSPSSKVTHLLLPVPSFTNEGMISGGKKLSDLLASLPKQITIIGGNLGDVNQTHNTFDLLQDEAYLAQNANITAHCAVKLVMQQLPCILQGCPILVVGWGRIGKCLTKLLSQLGSDVTIAARKEYDRGMATALGYRAIFIDEINTNNYRVILNTVPQLIMPDATGDALKVELASKPGITGTNILPARGLPNKEAPESSGKLIADTVIRYLNKEAKT